MLNRYFIDKKKGMDLARIDDRKIKEWISQYQSGVDTFSNIAEYLADFVYNYPQVRHQQDEEVCSAFFLYFFERLAKILLKYEKRNCEFVSWFVVVLRSQYLNWAKKYNKENQLEYQIDDMSLVKDENRLCENDFYQGALIQKAIGELPKKVCLAVKLHYFDFFKGSDLKDIAIVFKRNLDTLIIEYDAILSEIALEKEKEKKIFDKLNQEHYFINEIKNKLLVLEDKDNNLTKKLEYHQMRHSKLLNEYKKFYISLSYKSMSRFLGIKENAAYNLVFRAKLLLKKKLKENI